MQKTHIVNRVGECDWNTVTYECILNALTHVFVYVNDMVLFKSQTRVKPVKFPKYR